jgi:creatinine amidohydrolase
VDLAASTTQNIQHLSRDVPVVIPIAALEQHGEHLPLFTDTLLLTEICNRTRRVLSSQVLFAPVLWLGNSDHHLDFPGTISAASRTYLDMLRDMTESFLRHGFRRIVLLNGHGGNSVPAQQALFELRQKHRDRSDLLLLLANYWALGNDLPPYIPGLSQPKILHACQWETSMMMALHPDLVAAHQHLAPVDPGNPFLPAIRSSVTQDVTSSGYLGCPADATPEIGAQLLDQFTTDVINLLRRVITWNGSSWSG